MSELFLENRTCGVPKELFVGIRSFIIIGGALKSAVTVRCSVSDILLPTVKKHNTLKLSPGGHHCQSKRREHGAEAAAVVLEHHHQATRIFRQVHHTTPRPPPRPPPPLILLLFLKLPPSPPFLHSTPLHHLIITSIPLHPISTPPAGSCNATV